MASKPQATLPDEESRPLLVSFSGLDGSGKSTQIQNLVEHLEANGMRVARLAFWDDVVVGKRYREGFVHTVYGSERGIGTPDKPVIRRDKNVRRWYLTIARHVLYLLDAVQLCEVVSRARRKDERGVAPDVVVIDRYIYDQLANLPLDRSVTRRFVELVNNLVPKPDVAYLLDADVEAARARKPEYPVDFMQRSREAYFRLARLVRDITIIPPLPLAQAREAVIAAFHQRFRGTPQAA
jgi:thymidylate kinase